MARKQVDPKWIRNKSDEVAISEGCYFDQDEADHICDFFESFLKLTTGRKAGEPFILLDWQRDFLSRLNGWRRPDGFRRFRRAFVGISKKNGKSQLASGLALYFGIADGEHQPEIAMAASSREQANIMFRESKNMVKGSPSIDDVCNVIDSRKRIELPSQSGYIMVISSEASTSEGMNCSLVLQDETHVWYGRELRDSLKYAIIARNHGLIASMTTAGNDKESFCYEDWVYSQNVIKGDIIDTELLPIVYTAEGLDLDDPASWYAANPSLGVALSEKEFKSSMEEAKQSPVNWQSFQRYRLGIWSDSCSAWLDMVKWDKCHDPILDVAGLDGLECYGGMDLSHKKDLTSFTLFFPERNAILCWAWTTRYQVNHRKEKNKASYLQFIEDGELIVLDGDTIDEDFVFHKVLELREKYDIRSVAYDPWGCQHLALKLEEEGVDMASFRQGFASMSEPTKKLEELVLNEKLEHFGNGLLRWCASNAVVREDPAGNIKPDKEKSNEKIDALVSAVLSVGLAQVSYEKPTESVYESRGALVF